MVGEQYSFLFFLIWADISKRRNEVYAEFCSCFGNHAFTLAHISSTRFKTSMPTLSKQKSCIHLPYYGWRFEHNGMNGNFKTYFYWLSGFWEIIIPDLSPQFRALNTVIFGFVNLSYLILTNHMFLWAGT